MKRRFGLIEFLKASNPTLVVALEVILGVVLNLFSLFIFLHISNEILEKPTVALDMQLARFIYTLRTPVLTQLMLLFSFLGSGITLVVATLLSFFLLVKKHR